jgi:hypothetical protein
VARIAGSRPGVDGERRVGIGWRRAWLLAAVVPPGCLLGWASGAASGFCSGAWGRWEDVYVCIRTCGNFAREWAVEAEVESLNRSM